MYFDYIRIKIILLNITITRLNYFFQSTLMEQSEKGNVGGWNNYFQETSKNTTKSVPEVLDDLVPDPDDIPLSDISDNDEWSSTDDDNEF